jgi:hypothetical protein
VPSAGELRRLLRNALAYVAVWMGNALFIASQEYRTIVASGGEVPWGEVLHAQLISAFLWASFTPVIVAAGERLAFQRHRIRDAVLLLVIVPLLAVVRIAGSDAFLELFEDHTASLPLAESVGIRFHGDVFRILVIIAITCLVCAWNEAREREGHAAELAATLARARIDELHTRLQPEFLTQALHAIAERIRQADPSSDALIVGLSDLLREVLYLGRRGRSTLEGELDLLDRFLSFQQLASGRPIASRFELDDALLRAEVPLMLLQPLLSEAIAGAPRGGNGPLHITVRGRQEGDVLKLEVEDDAGSPTRIAPARLRERALTHLAGASVESHTRGPLHTTLICLPLAPEGSVA